MRISQFCLTLKSYYTCDFLYADPERETYTFKPFPEEDSFEQNVLYVCTEQTSCNPCSAAFSLLLYAEDALDRLSLLRQDFPHANIICVQKKKEDPLSSFYDTASDIFLAENRFTSQVNHLSQISSSSRGLQALIDEASQILDAPIVVIDTSYRLLAMSNTELLEDEAHLEEQRRIGALTERNLSRMRRDRIFELIRRQPDRMVYGIAPDAHHWWTNMLVYVHGVEVAEVGIMENRRKFTDYDFELMKHLRYLISLEIQRGHFFGENYSVAHSLLVAELLEQTFTMPEVIRHRTGLLGWQASPFYYIFSVFPKSDQAPLPKRFRRQGEILASQISHQLPRSYWCIGERDLVFLIPCEKRNGEEIPGNARLAEMLNNNHMMGILSNPVTTLMDVREAYVQTKALYRMREYLPDDTPLHLYADHSILHIAAILYQTHSLEEFYHPYALTIRDHDRKYHTDFLSTLYEYLTYIDNPSVIAKHLNIHKNTLYYRMNKLKELFPIDLNDGGLRLRLQLTMELMRLEQNIADPENRQ